MRIGVGRIMEAMNPCPFCGSKETVVDQEYALFYVRCDNCGASASCWETTKEAIEAWNERPENQVEIIPRRPFLDDTPDGLVENDRDFVMNNFDACVTFLERLEDIRNV